MTTAEVSKRLFTAEEYLRMAETGILAEHDRVELIDGEIVAMTPIGPRHFVCVNRANKVFVLTVGEQAVVHVQTNVRLGRYQQPEPDLALLRPPAGAYETRLPGPNDIFLIVEVADSSLEYDRTVKARLYAESGIPEYWLVNLHEDVVTRYQDSRQGAYQSTQEYRRGQSIAPALLPECSIPVDKLFAD